MLFINFIFWIDLHIRWNLYICISLQYYMSLNLLIIIAILHAIQFTDFHRFLYALSYPHATWLGAPHIMQ